MAYLQNVGEVSTDGRMTIRWTIPRCMQFPQEHDTTLSSPHFNFRFEDGCWLYFYPNGSYDQDNEGWIGVACGVPFMPSANTAATFSMVDREGREILETVAKECYPCYDQHRWIRRREFEARSEEVLPEGTLNIVFRMVRPQAKITQEDEVSGLHNLSQQWKDLYVREEGFDFTINVRGREFRAHRLVLKVRIPAFYAMLTHDMAENAQGVVSMEDCDPDVFHEFLLFAYSGRVENISSENMCGLYVLADKYDLQDLKKLCLNFIKSALSVEMICDIVSLATTHEETELLDLATDFFATNAEQILETAKWQLFLRENPEEGNKLFIKTVKLGKRKRTSQ